jgi:hypothetical protein
VSDVFRHRIKRDKKIILSDEVRRRIGKD